MLNGPVPKIKGKLCGVVSTHSLKIVTEHVNQDLELNSRAERFWDLKSIGASTKERDFVDEFQDKIDFSSGRYEVELPF